jgi:molybdopterin-guanine dinucleotide biosynthesis protein A
MPWLNRDLLNYQISLRAEADIIVPRWQKFPEPLHAIYSKSCLPAIAENLQADRIKITGFFGKVTVRFIERDEIGQFDSDGRSFRNVNTPDDLKAVHES